MYCTSRGYFNHSTGHNRYTRFYEVGFGLVSSGRGRVRRRHRLLSLGSLYRVSRLRRLTSTNTASFGVRKHLGSMGCIGGIITTCDQGLSRVITTGPSGCYETSFNHTIRDFRPGLGGAFGEKFAGCFLGKQRPSVTSFSAPGTVNRCINGIGRVENGISFGITAITDFTGNSNLYFVGSRGRLRKFHMGHIRNGQLCPLHVPRRLHPNVTLCHGGSRTFRGVLSGGATDHGVPLRVEIAPRCSRTNTLRRILVRVNTSIGIPRLSSVAARNFLRGRLFCGVSRCSCSFRTPLRLTEHPRNSGVELRLDGVNGAVFRYSRIILTNSLRGCFVPGDILSRVHESLVRATARKVRGVMSESLIGNIIRRVFSTPCRLGRTNRRRLGPRRFM